MSEILGLNKEDLLNYHPRCMFVLSVEEILYIFKTMDAAWFYDHEAAKQGKPGRHALLKSQKHSDGFLYSRLVLNNHSLCRLMAYQLYWEWKKLGLEKPDYVAGIPDGATQLGVWLADFLGVDLLEMEKDRQGRIKLVSAVPACSTLLLAEDFCTAGTGFKEAVLEIKWCNNTVKFEPYELVLINRGGLSEIVVPNVDTFKIKAVATHRISDWDPRVEECMLCKMGSIAIKPKPKDHPENWELLVNSQK